MAIDTLRGMDVYVDERGEYHFLTKGGSVARATNSEENWTYVGVMYPHMQEFATEADVAPPATTE